MDLIVSKMEQDEFEEPIEESSNEFLKTLSGIAPLIIEKLQKQS